MMIIRRKSMNQGVLMRDITISTPFTTRETAGGKILNRSLAEITSITGNTLVLNQLANSSEEVHVAGQTKANITTFDKAKVGDKLYIKVKVKKESVITFVDPGVSTTEEISLRVGDANSGQRVMLIDDIPTDVEYHVVSALVTNGNADNDTLVVSSTNIDEIYAKDAVIINLTRMYGSGNEPTIKEFEQAYPLDYYDQTDGRLLDFKGTTLVSKDSSENVLDTVSLDVTTLTGKLCEKIFPDGLKRAGNVYDEIKVENGQLYAIKRVGSVNLGSLTTSYLTVSDVNFFQCTIPNADMLPSTPNITSSRYFPTNVPFGDVSNMYVKPHDTIGNYIYIRNDSYTTAASFKTAMSGVLLYYELATEQRYLIDTTDPYIAKYKVDGWGTEEIVLDTNACSPSMTINYPDNSTENIRFTYRKTADGAKLNVNGDAFITNIKGETISWNQLVTPAATTVRDITTTVNNGVITINGTSVSGDGGRTTPLTTANPRLFANHKYYICTPTRVSGASITWYLSNSSTYAIVVNVSEGKSIVTNTTNATCIFGGNFYGNSSYNYKGYIQIIDLTLIYGSGSEPSTVAAFEADYLKWFGKPLTYEAYDAGSLKPVKMLSMKTVGFNLFDKDKASQNTRISSTGNVHTQSGYFCSDYIKVFPNTQYYLRNVCRIQQYTTCIFYDINKNFIGYTNISGTGTGSGTITTSSNTAYIRTNTGLLSFLDSTCVSLVNDGSRNGQYASSWSNTSMLNVTEIKGIAVNNGEPTGNLVTIFPDGMKSAGNVYDYIGKENGFWVAYKRVGSIDLGTLSWSVYGNYSYILRSKFSNAKQVPSITVVPNATISNEYSVNNLNSVIQNQNLDRLFSIGNPYDGNSIIIHDSRYNSSTINEALDGVILNYELATPQKYILDNTMRWLYKIDQQGIEQILPENTSVPTTSPAKLNIKYKTIKPTQLIKVSQTNTNLRSCRVLYGQPYSVRILPYDGFSLYEDPIIKMGGVDITSTAYDPTYNMISIASVTGDVDIECYAMYAMPSDYVRVDGIKNPSNAYLNTNYTPSYKNTITVDFTTTSEEIAGYVISSKSAGTTTSEGTQLRCYADGTVRYDPAKTGAIIMAGMNAVGRNSVIIDHYNGKIYGNGKLKRSYSKGTNVDGRVLWLFRCSNTGDTIQSPNLIINLCYIFDGTTKVYKRYYIPCLNASGVAGFWDAARGVFQGSSNSTAFDAVFEGTTTISSQFTKRTTADGATLALPTAKVISVKGNTLVWNQLVTGEERTATGYFGVLSANFTSVNGHRYYIRFDAIANVDNATRGFVIGNTSSFISTTFSATLNSNNYTTVSTYKVISSASTYASLKRSDKNGNSVTIKNLVIIDLSQMFGYGNEPSVADFEKMFFPNVFYSKAAPSLLNFTATSIASKNAVGTTIWNEALDVTTITGKVNGEGDSVAIFPDGMKSVNSVYDEIVKEDGVWVAYKRIGSNNLGEVNYAYNSSYAAFFRTVQGVITGKNYIPFVLPKYSKASGVGQNNLTDKSYGVNTLSGKSWTDLYIKDSAYSDTTAFKNSLDGVMFYFELATPIKYVLDNPLPEYYKALTGGVEQILPENGATPTTSPANMSITYKTIE